MPSSDPAGGTAPKLTAGQRLLLLLPRLQRSETPPDTGQKGPSAGPRPTGGGAAGAATAKTTPAAAKGAGAKGAEAPAGTGTTNGKSGTNGQAGGKGAPAGHLSVVEPEAPTRTFGARLRDSMLKPKPEPKLGPSGKAPTKSDPYPDKTSAELKHLMKYLDDQERLLTLIAAPIAAILGITSLVFGLRNNPAVGHKGHASVETIVIVGSVALVLSVAVLVSGLLRRRSFAIFSLVFVGFGVDSLFSIWGVLPFWGLAGWMFVRSSKMQRSLTSRGDHPRQQRGRAGAGSRAGGTARRSRRGAPTPEPSPSKRYTPPKPKEEDRRK